MTMLYLIFFVLQQLETQSGRSTYIGLSGLFHEEAHPSVLQVNKMIEQMSQKLQDLSQ